MREKAASVLKIACEYGYDEYGAHCKYLHFNLTCEKSSTLRWGMKAGMANLRK